MKSAGSAARLCIVLLCPKGPQSLPGLRRIKHLALSLKAPNPQL